MKYIVIEIQKSENGTISTLTWDFDDINQAESKYHLVLSAAAVSSVPVHTAVLLNETGYSPEHKCYDHREPEPEPTEQEGL